MLKTFITLFLVLLTTTIFAGDFGSIACPKGKIVAKSGGAYYIPSTGQFGVQFYKDAATEEQIDWLMSEHAASLLHRPVKKGPKGKEGPYNYPVMIISGSIDKKLTKVSAKELAKQYYTFFYICDSQAQIPTLRDTIGATKKHLPELSGELKPGSKINVKTTGTYNGDPKTSYEVKVTLGVKGAVKLRVYE
jgi:hypothetical protein